MAQPVVVYNKPTLSLRSDSRILTYKVCCHPLSHESQSTAGDNLGCRFWLAFTTANGVKCINNFFPLNDLSEHNMLLVKPAARHEGDEELGAVGVGASISHRKKVWLGVLHSEVLVSKLFTIDGLASSAVVLGEVSSLSHEV